MLQTALFDLPYPEDTDAPDGPAQLQALAEAVEGIKQPYCGVSRPSPANWDVAPDADVDVTFPTEIYDAFGFHAANAATLVVPAGMGGLYVVVGTAKWEQFQGYWRRARIRTTGGLIIAGGEQKLMVEGDTSANANITNAVSALVALSAGNSVKLTISHSWVGAPAANQLDEATFGLCRLGAE